MSARHVLRAAGGARLFRARNSLVQGGLKETVSTRDPGRLTWYACGPTVYDDAHLGHARTYVSFDILRRVLSSLARVDIEYALGVTDVDDKILARAAETNVPPQTLARRFEARFFADLSALNVLPPTRVLRVTEHIPEIVDYISQLVDAGRAYTAAGGDVYFSVASSGARYGQLDPSRALDPAVQPDPDGAKRDARDFTLWKGAGEAGTDAGSARWGSPWGSGRPGWHVECAAMVRARIGERLDIHSGGIDLRFPHHENEIALAEAAGCGGPGPAFARWAHTWLHAGHLHMTGRKMSKSLKNFVSIREFLADGGDADAFRVFCLLHRYGAPVDFAQKSIDDAAGLLARLRRFVAEVGAGIAGALENDGGGGPRMGMQPCEAAEAVEAAITDAKERIEEALVDDFDTPRAISAISELVTAANRQRTHQAALGLSGAFVLARARAGDVVSDTMTMLGVSWMQERAVAMDKGDAKNKPKDFVDAMVQMRSEVRRAAVGKDMGKIFAFCDKARDMLRDEFGVEVSDAPDGSSAWQFTASPVFDSAARNRRQGAARRTSFEDVAQE